ncbi:GNAT family N-acetyltransferase [Chryseobacterium sp. G0240]|uniref:GNAT family N-acetyltransferase n=1 Tax=Chryseobacterium sp. G0240 TaxID=2487066 RepID=UPI000F44DF7F|nr:GNAT family N-acetyltransferase [Chryseobacterium sp. G0240]ROI02177.1 GNAT family N-acetyltransferase [Chryseobacterium sp. G0240]
MHNVLIRPLVKEDALTSYQWRNDPEIWQFTGSRPDITITKEIESEWIEKVLKDDTSKRFAILCDREYIGNVQLTGITDESAEFHIFIGKKAFWGKGISQLATYQILYYAKEVLKLKEVYLSVNPENVAAVKSYQKNNFVVKEQNEEQIKMSVLLSELPAATVSVFVMVYNHAEYLKECIDNILVQKTNFNYDIVIGEDCSKDNSREILLDYQKLYPGKFKLLLYSQNMGAVNNQNEIFKNCKGKYIAICEGDDYWTDPLKLQKQVDFLEENTDYSIHSGHAQRLIEGKLSDVIGNSHHKKTYQLKDFFTQNNLVACTSMFRNYNIHLDYFKNIYFGDWMLYADILTAFPDSKAYVSEECYSVYRVNESGAMLQLEGIKSDQKHFFQIERINHFFKTAYSDQDIITINEYAINIYKYFLIHNDLTGAFNIFWRHFKLINFKIPFRKYLSYFRYRKQLA